MLLTLYAFTNAPHCPYSAWLKGSAHSTVGTLDHRISMLTGLNVQHPFGEYLQVVNYGIGGHYEPHFDHATVRGPPLLFYAWQNVNIVCCFLYSSLSPSMCLQSPSSPVFRLKTGNRVATFMIYVSDCETCWGFDNSAPDINTRHHSEAMCLSHSSALLRQVGPRPSSTPTSAFLSWR